MGWGVLQSEHHSRPQGGKVAHDGLAYCSRHLLHLLQHSAGVEICEHNSLLYKPCAYIFLPGRSISEGSHLMVQERAFEESQKYKEGKYILEKAKLMKVL